MRRRLTDRPLCYRRTTESRYFHFAQCQWIGSISFQAPRKNLFEKDADERKLSWERFFDADRFLIEHRHSPVRVRLQHATRRAARRQIASLFAFANRCCCFAFYINTMPNNSGRKPSPVHRFVQVADGIAKCMFCPDQYRREHFLPVLDFDPQPFACQLSTLAQADLQEVDPSSSLDSRRQNCCTLAQVQGEPSIPYPCPRCGKNAARRQDERR